MLINLRNALMTGKRLPYDAEVEYLESTGTQWVDIDASKVATASRYVCSGKYMANTNQAMMWSHGYRGIRSYGARISFVTRKYATTDTSVSYNTECIIEFDAVSLKGILTSLSGTELASVTIGSSSASGGLRIFAASETATGYLASQSRIYFMRVYDTEGNILLDFIPVRRGTVGYLYDRVSGKLFGNAGTGDFVLGQDVVPVEYIESHGTEWIDTGVYGNESTHATIVAASKAFTSSSDVTDNAQGIFGYAANYSMRVWGKSYHSTYGLLSFGFKQGWTNGSQIYAQSSDQYLTIELRPYGNTSCRMYIDGTASTRSSYGGAFTTAGTIWLGKIGGGNTYNGVNMRIKSFSIEGKCDYKPIRVGTDATSWEGAMMDTLTRHIYRNAGTGAFAYGNDLKYPISAA